jgi:DNA-binding NarL/FixJ family response regulator
MRGEGAILKSILIVDDSSAIRKGLRNLLSNDTDVRVCGEATNGKEAIERARELHPDVIVLDVSMPVLNGLQAAPVLHRMLPGTSIILFTSYGKAVAGHSRTAGIDAVISKDDGVTSLLETIHTLAMNREKPSPSDPQFN